MRKRPSGHSHAIFDVVNSSSYPGWGFMIDQGATTLWETWRESDNTYSNCHPMFGSVSQWIYQWLGGIRPDPSYPGFARFHLSPLIPPGLDSMECNYISPQGEIISSWSKEGPAQWGFDFTVPDKSVAMVKLPAEKFRHLTITETRSGKTSTPDQATINSGEFDLTPGKYHISATGL
jgi:alpha-L-rhamnosidase